MRIDKDGIGEIELPYNVYYGSESYRSYLNFQISGTQVHPIMIRNYLLLKKAAAIANKKCGVIDTKISDTIVLSVNELLKTDFKRHFIIDTYQAGAGTSQNMNANEVIANKANEILGGELGAYRFVHPNDHVNKSQSTNDTYPTVMQLSCLTLSQGVVIELELLAKAFEEKSLDFNHVLKAGRTHLQDAVPIRLGQEFKAYQVIVEQIKKLIIESQSYLRQLGIGGSAIGTGINVPRNFPHNILSELKEIFDDNDLQLADDMCASMQSQMPIIIYSNALRVCALELTKILNDLRLLSSGPTNGFGEILLPVVQSGSSIMPGKINPSVLEMGNQVMFKVLGNDSALGFAIQAGQLELNVMMPLMAHLVLESSQILMNAIFSIREKCILGIQANLDQCSKHAMQSPQIATALNPILGYKKVGEVVKEALSNHTTVLEIVKKYHLLNDKQIEDLLNIERLTGNIEK